MLDMTERRVLVVDDDDHIREVATLALEVVGGWQVISTNSGADAAELARAERPDAVLLDVMMPGVDGPSTVARLREDPMTAEIPVILLTAKNLSVDRRDFSRLALAGMIPKPFDPMTLAGQVAQMLGWVDS
ncbi:response regulator [Microlunatus ginsengisoli]|uniref:Response regulator n=2 Tax=Microlunatus ginsengisoli TaxID=363863 RepID=A0ABP6ZSD7_9ACTN